MEHCVFIHSNPKQIVGAIVAQHALRRNSRSADKFDVKIITTDGTVTLRGPVKSAQEKAWVAAAAHRAPGVKRVDNQLEIERN